VKRLRTLSIARPEALNRRLCRQAWGQPYWRRLSVRKRLEWELRQMRRIAIFPLVRVEPEVILPGEAPLDETSGQPVRH